MPTTHSGRTPFIGMLGNDPVPMLSNGWPCPAGLRASGVNWKVVEVNRHSSGMVHASSTGSRWLSGVLRSHQPADTLAQLQLRMLKRYSATATNLATPTC
jgi:hypothetical protein